MHFQKRITKPELDDLYRLIAAVAADKARLLNLEPLEYLLGILEGRFPAIDESELVQKHASLAAPLN